MTYFSGLICPQGCDVVRGGRVPCPCDIQRCILQNVTLHIIVPSGSTYRNGITTRSVEKKKSFEPPIQENCANKSRGDTLTQMLLAVICAELLPPVGFCLLSVIVLMDFQVCTKNLTVHVSDTCANKFCDFSARF